MNDCCRVRPVQGIIHCLSFPTGLNQIIAAQAGQMLGQGRLAQADLFFQITDGPFSRLQNAQDHKAMLIAHRL